MSEGIEYQLGMFREHVGRSFQVRRESIARTFELVDATPYNAGDGDDTRRFTLVFRDPDASVESHLPQAMYACELGSLGQLDLFLVPIGPGPEQSGIDYEAIFNSRQ